MAPQHRTDGCIRWFPPTRPDESRRGFFGPAPGGFRLSAQKPEITSNVCFPGGHVRRVRFLVSSLLVGIMSLGVAWAGAGLAPVAEVSPVEAPRATVTASPAEGAAPGSDTPRTTVRSGEVLAGAARLSIEPRPEDYGGTWETEGCATFGSDAGGAPMHVPDFRVKWPENPNCIYMGGYGIGPMNPIVKWTDDYGLWVRSVAVSDGTDTVVLTLLDGVYYFAKYRDMCDGCGAQDLAEELGGELDISPDSFFFTATHSHTAPDFIGGWGGVPDWYMEQVADTIRAAVREAVGSLRPATLEAGEVLARDFNGERRDFYRSAEEQSLTWFRLLETPGAAVPTNDGDPGAPDSRPTPGRAIATVGAFAAHPTTADESTGIADADFPAVFSHGVEDRFGGIGLFFQTGLGNMSARGNKIRMGEGLAGLVPDIGSGLRIDDPDVRVARRLWDQPVTNSGLTALGLPGFFDREFNQTPASVSAGKNSTRACRSASSVSVRTSASAAKIGDLWITGGPGELFSNLTNTIKERNPNGVSLPLGMVNDALGYIMQYFETDHAGRQVLGFVGDPLAEYEDAYSIDHCFGEMTLEATIEMLGEL